MKVTKETIIIDVIRENPDTARYFYAIGMHCIGCPASLGESIEDACFVHGVDPDELVEELNRYFGETESADRENEEKQ